MSQAKPTVLDVGNMTFSGEENEQITRVGPGTLMGDFFGSTGCRWFRWSFYGSLGG